VRRAKRMRLRLKVENFTAIEEIANNVADLVNFVIGYFRREIVSYFTRLFTNSAHWRPYLQGAMMGLHFGRSCFVHGSF